MSTANELERMMLDLINQERADVGADPLALETNLNAAAEDHSAWLLEDPEGRTGGPRSHIGEGGSDVTERMVDAGFDLALPYGVAENYAPDFVGGDEGLADDVLAAHEGLMNSARHRANILNPDFEVMGIGIEANDDLLIAIQKFASTAGEVDLDEPGSAPMTPAPDEPVPEPDPATPVDGPAPEPEEPQDEAEPDEADTPPLPEPPMVESDPEPEEPADDPEAEEPVAEGPEDEPEPEDQPETEEPDEEPQDPEDGPVAEGPVEDPEPVEPVEEPEPETPGDEPVAEEPEAEDPEDEPEEPVDEPEADPAATTAVMFGPDADALVEFEEPTSEAELFFGQLDDVSGSTASFTVELLLGGETVVEATRLRLSEMEEAQSLEIAPGVEFDAAIVSEDERGGSDLTGLVGLDADAVTMDPDDLPLV